MPIAMTNHVFFCEVTGQEKVKMKKNDKVLISISQVVQLDLWMLNWTGRRSGRWDTEGVIPVLSTIGWWETDSYGLDRGVLMG